MREPTGKSFSYKVYLILYVCKVLLFCNVQNVFVFYSYLFSRSEWLSGKEEKNVKL